MSIVNTIRALLAKATSTDNEHEAEIFFAKAKELMDKHQLDAGDLEVDDPVAEERVYRRNGAAAPDWDFMLIFNVARYYGCKAIRISLSKGYEMGLIGRESARVTAQEMHKYLVTTVRRLGREAAANKTFPRYDRAGNFVGYMNADQASRRIGNALRSRIGQLAALNEQAEPSTAAGRNALVTVDRVLAVYKELHPDAAPIGGTYFTNDKARAIASGIGLNRQTGGGAPTLRLS